MAELTSKITHGLIADTGKTPDLVSGMTPENFKMETSQIVFLADGVEVSRVVFNEPDDFTLAEIVSPATISRISVEGTLKDTNKWLAYIKLFKQLPKKESDFKTEIEKNESGGKVEYKFTLGADLLINLTFDRETNLIDFGTRDESTILIADYSNFLAAFNDFMLKYQSL